jgi:hypothetical protein
MPQKLFDLIQGYAKAKYLIPAAYSKEQQQNG